MNLFCRAAALALLLLARSAGAAEAGSYEAIDRHALKATPANEESVTKLAKYLVEPCKTDEEKARAVYRWITDRIEFSAEAYLSGKPGDNRTENVLKNRKCVCEGYANLFAALATRAGLKTIKIHGYCKAADFTSGSKFSDTNHAWNVVEIDGKWRLVDSTWGAGVVTEKKFVKQYADAFFLIAPEKLIWTHLPERPAWQMIKPAITLKQFEQQPIVGRALLVMGVTPEQIKTAMSKKPFRGFATAFTYPGLTVTLIDVPLGKILQAGKTYSFEIRSNDCAGAVLAHNGKFVFPEKKRNVFRGSIKVEKGKLQFGAAPKDKEKEYMSVLEYEVE